MTKEPDTCVCTRSSRPSANVFQAILSSSKEYALRTPVLAVLIRRFTNKGNCSHCGTSSAARATTDTGCGYPVFVQRSIGRYLVLHTKQ